MTAAHARPGGGERLPERRPATMTRTNTLRSRR